MIKALRTMRAFVALTITLLIWMFVWSLVSPVVNGDHIASSYSQRPAYVLARGITGKHYSSYVEYELGYIRVAETLSGPRVVGFKERLFPDHRRQILSYGELWGAPGTGNAYGLLAPVVYQHTAHYMLDTSFPHIPIIDNELALQTAHDAGEIKHLPLNGWHFSLTAAIHDTLFLLTLIAWLISLTAIHRWPIWKHITTAQRRRAKDQCPTCAYDLAGLTTQTCPECGHDLQNTYTNGRTSDD